MAFDPIVVGCDWQATLIVDPTIGQTAQTIVTNLTGATVAARLIDATGTVRATGTATITSTTERTVEVVFTASTTRQLAPGVGHVLDVRVTTSGGQIRPVQVREKIEVRPFTVGVR